MNEVKARIKHEIVWVKLADKDAEDAYKTDKSGIYQAVLDNDAAEFPGATTGRLVNLKFDGDKMPEFDSFVSGK